MKIGRKLGERARAAATPALERLRAGEDEEPAAGPASEAADPIPGPHAVYARVLDGDSLWLAVAGATGPIGIRRTGADEVIRPANDAPPDDELASLRWHLPSALPGDDAGVFEIVTADGAPVRSRRPLADPSPMRTPSSRDGRWQFAVRRREGGALVVRRDPRELAADIVGMRLIDDAVVFTLTDPGMGAVRLQLVDDEGSAVSQRPITREGNRLVGTVRADDIPGTTSGAQWLLALGNDSGSVPLLRHRNDSATPGRSTVLPLLWTGEGDDRTRVRFHYQPGGRLRVSRPTSESTTEDGDT